MKTATIRDLRDKQPFQPFSIHMADGRIVPVTTPDHILISPRNDDFVVYPPEDIYKFWRRRSSRKRRATPKAR